MKHRVVITGLGAVTPIGNDYATFWRRLKEGYSGVGPITHFDSSNLSVHFAAEVKDFNPCDFMSKKDARRNDRFTQLAMVAAKEVHINSGLVIDEDNSSRIGVIIGSGIGGIISMTKFHQILLENGPSRVSPFMIPSMIINMAAGQVSIMLGAKGQSSSIVSACATGTNNIGDAFKILQRGDADAIFAGGAEATICPLAFAGFISMGALAKNNEEPQKASCPFTKLREGFVMGEGAGIILLETLEHAQKRRAHIYAEITGYGCTSDAYHITQPIPDGEGALLCMKRALQDAHISPTDVDYINAHGTSTLHNDLVETVAIKRLFGDHAYKLALSSNKSMVGHLLGAAGGIEAIATVLTLHEQVIPPTINYDIPDPECDLDYVPHKSRCAKVDIALSNSFGFGGHNATLVFQRFIV